MMLNDQKPIAGLPDNAPVDTRPRRGGVAPDASRRALFNLALDSGRTASVWTLSGLVLAGCGGGGGTIISTGSTNPQINPNPEDRASLYPSATIMSPPRDPITVKVVGGIIMGAHINADRDGIDTDGDGELEYDRLGVQNAPIRETNILGEVKIPRKYANMPLAADLFEYRDIQNGIGLRRPYEYKEWLPLPRTDINAEPLSEIIISPLTDLIARDRSGEANQKILDDIFGVNVVSIADIIDPENYLFNTDTIEAQLISHAAMARGHAGINIRRIFGFARDFTPVAGKEDLEVLFAPYREKESDKDMFDPMIDLTDSLLRRGVLSLLPDSGHVARPVILHPARLEAGALEDITLTHLDTRAKIEEFFGFSDPLKNMIRPDEGMEGIFIDTEVIQENGTVEVTSGGTPLDSPGFPRTYDFHAGLPIDQGFHYIPFGMIDELQFSAGENTGGIFKIPFYVYDGERWSDADEPGYIVVDFSTPLEYTPEEPGGVTLSDKVSGWQRIGQITLSGREPGTAFKDINPLQFRIDAMTYTPGTHQEPGLEAAPTAIFSADGVEIYRIRKHEMGERFIFEVNARNYDAATHGLPTIHIDGYDAINSFTDIPFTVIDDVLIHEHHPLHKPVYDFAAVAGTVTATWELREAANGGGMDNGSFRITEDGRIWFNENPDFEKPIDVDGDNSYEVTAHRTFEGITTTHSVSVVVQDITQEFVFDREFDSGRDVVFYEELPEELLPDSYARNLIWGYLWDMPESGPLTLTWGLGLNPELWKTTLPALGSNRHDPISTIHPYNLSKIRSLQNIEDIRAQMEDAFNLFEEIGNFKFIEIDDTVGDLGTNRDHITIHIIDLNNNILGQANSPGAGGSIALDYGFVDDDLTDDSFDWVLVHEIGHILGLSHPFPSYYYTPTAFRNGWPYNSDYRRGEGSELSMMSYHCGAVDENLQCILDPQSRDRIFEPQRADIAALEFLYGEKGTDNIGLKGLLADAGIRASAEPVLPREDDASSPYGHGYGCGCACCGQLRLKDKEPELFDALYVDEEDEAVSPSTDFA